MSSYYYYDFDQFSFLISIDSYKAIVCIECIYFYFDCFKSYYIILIYWENNKLV